MSSSRLAVASVSPPALDTRAIARFFGPLMLNAWLMTLAGPVLNVAVGRAADARLELAAFWLAFTLVLVCQSACLVVQPVTASALGRREPLAAITAFTVLVGLSGSLAVLALAHAPLATIVFQRLVPTPEATALLAREVLVRLAPLPLLVALRGLASGQAVHQRRTTWLALATVLRVAVLAGLAALVLGLGRGAGALAAAGMLVTATAVETAFMSVVMLRRQRAAEPAGAHTRGRIAIAAVLRTAVPLATASLVWTATRPLVGAVLGRLADPELAQAGFGVVLPVLFLTCAPLWAFLDVAIVLPRRPADVDAIVRFAIVTALAFAAGIALLAFTPLADLVLHPGHALPAELARLVRPALAVIALEPLVLAARALAQGVLVRAGRAPLVLALSPLKLALMLVAGLLVAHVWPHANGAVLAIALFVGGDAVDALVFGWAARGAVQTLFRHEAPEPVAGETMERRAA